MRNTVTCKGGRQGLKWNSGCAAIKRLLMQQQHHCEAVWKLSAAELATEVVEYFCCLKLGCEPHT